MPRSASKRSGSRHSADEHLLHDLFGEDAVGEHAPREPETRSRVAAVELGERALVAVDDRSRERRVVGGAALPVRQRRSSRGQPLAHTAAFGAGPTARMT